MIPTIPNEIYFVILALVAAIATGLVGAFALMKRMTLAADALSHVALPGLGIAILWGINPLIGGATALLIGSLMVWQLEKKSGLATETAVGVVFSASLAIGALVTPSEDLIEALFGNFSPISFKSFLLGFFVALTIILFILKFRNQLTIATFSPELALTSGIKLNQLNLAYLLIFTATIVLGLRFLGALLVGSLVIIPAAISRQFAHQLKSFLWGSAIASMLSVFVGMMFARYYYLQFGPTVVTVAAGFFLLSLFKKQK